MAKKVLLALSGGVDSSVAAILLKQQGYEVIAATMQLLEKDDSAVQDAKKVCEKLQIEHYIIDCKKTFQEKVINDFIQTYQKAETPNPCIQCNRFLKFGEFYKHAKMLGCDYIATGHYAKIEWDEAWQQYVIKKSNAIGKDQTYVLYGIQKELLSHILFPLWNFEDKDQIREIARKAGLEVFNKKDSQEICFIKDNQYAKFIKTNSQKEPLKGNIVDLEGKILGQHNGLLSYTIGQRKGIGITSQQPMYVVGFKPQENELIVGKEQDLYQKELRATDINFLLPLEKEQTVTAKIRYSAREEEAVLYKENENQVFVVFKEPQRAVTPGQSVVFYRGDILLGGGKIIR